MVPLLSTPASGEEPKHEWIGRLGLHFFTGDLEDVGHDKAFDGTVAYGYRIHPRFSAEVATGYFHEGVSWGNDVRGIPLTLTGIATMPIGAPAAFAGTELYAGLGIGAYYVKYRDLLRRLAPKRDVVPGGHALVGARLLLSPTVFVGIEGRYTHTLEADLGDLRADLNGIAVTASLGLRF